ncbi:MAG: YciI family protein [Anaerolineaceae bacterium]|nr:YciI family protein [Anaerolineaceae bacterium]MCY3907993.1 YciI family protein [Anaerolineaceae bacterium]
MRVMVLVKATRESEAGLLPSTDLLEAMGHFNQELIDAGIMQAGEGLRPSSEGKRVIFDGETRTVQDGPFEATSELVAGFWIWEVKDMGEALAWARRCPNTMPGGGELELRPLFEAEDFGEAMTPELREQEEQQRRALADE